MDGSGDHLLEQISMPVSDEVVERRRVSRILLRLQRYVRGYLPDLRIETDEDFSKNPAEVTIRVWWKDEREHL
jgi:hypothetical protein